MSIRPRMAKIAMISIVLLAYGLPLSNALNPDRSIDDRAPDTAYEGIKEIFRIISTGRSTEKEDEQLVKLIKDEIVRTSQGIETPSGSIEVAARRARRLVTELTAAYASAIYKSKSTREAKLYFARFQNTVHRIVDFVKNGQFVV